jgi:2'-5' RNA ligase
MRAFIATFLSDANQAVSDMFGARAAELSQRVLRPVPPRSSHLTHVFLGEIGEAVVAAVIRDLDEVMTGIAPVPFCLGQPALLRGGREPRLVFAQLEAGREAAEAVTRAIADRVRRQPALGHVEPSRSAHATLARFRRGAGSRETALVAELLATSQIATAWQPDALAEVQLVRSELTSNGPVYRVVAKARAGRRA